MDPTQDHVLTIYNFPDARFADTSEITFYTLIVTVDDGQSSGLSILSRCQSMRSLTWPNQNLPVKSNPVSYFDMVENSLVH